MDDNVDRWEMVISEATNEYGETHEFANAMPLFGDEHEPHPGCWCNPEHDPENWHILIHNHNFKVIEND
jgi:hypothetical protein